MFLDKRHGNNQNSRSDQNPRTEYHRLFILYNPQLSAPLMILENPDFFSFLKFIHTLDSGLLTVTAFHIFDPRLIIILNQESFFIPLFHMTDSKNLPCSLCFFLLHPDTASQPAGSCHQKCSSDHYQKYCLYRQSSKHLFCPLPL